MGTTFDALGFFIPNDEAYNRLAEQASERGDRTTIYRRGAKLHGRCLKVGQGLEIWTVLYECEEGVFYADCRPAFRPEHIVTLNSWELTEYDEDGEAMMCGYAEGSQIELLFQLQNLTELDSALFRQQQLFVALAGLAYSVTGHTRRLAHKFAPVEKTSRKRRLCENDYNVRGTVLACRRLHNPLTQSELLWVYLDIGSIKLDILVNSNDVRGEVKVGKVLSATIWLQGYIFDDAAVAALYEGIDRSFQPSDFWVSLRREN